MTINWQKLREEVLERDNYTCQTCLQPIDRLDVHHVIPKKKNGSYSLNNLTTVCRKCHGLIETAEPFKPQNLKAINNTIVVRIDKELHKEIIAYWKYGESFSDTLRKYIMLQQNTGGKK